jgi:hypothetical protein
LGPLALSFPGLRRSVLVVVPVIRCIEVAGPNESGGFVATLPSGETRPLRYWQDLEDLKGEWGIVESRGDLVELSRRSRPD